MLRSDASLLHPIASPYCHSYLDTSMKQLRRLKTAKITLAFEDARCHFRNRPEVVTIAPADNFFINKNADTRDVEQSVNASPNVSATGVAGNLGCVWEMSQIKRPIMPCARGNADINGNRTTALYGTSRRMPSETPGSPASSSHQCFSGGEIMCRSNSPSRSRRV